MEHKILIVEDSLTQAIKLEIFLEQQGYTVDVAKNGKEALKSIEKSKPDIVITDIIMPEMDGYELCRHIKTEEEFKDILVILLTTLSDPKDIIRGLECRADNFITKPYNEEILLKRINNIIANQKIRENISLNGKLDIIFDGENYSISSDRLQMLDLLLSTYENSIQKNEELKIANRELSITKGELENRNKELEKLNEQKNQIIGMAAHDLRNPLGGILAYSEFLIEEIPDVDDEHKEFLSIIKSTSEFMLTMVNDLLDISIIDAGKLNLNLAPIDIVSLIKHNISINKLFAEKKNIIIHFDTENDIPDVMIDSGKIEQVLNNLISNAIKFSFPESNIYITIKRTGENNLLISVRDEGQGIPKRELNKLFKPFGKTSIQGTDGETSTGLGLVIVRNIINGHKGEIWVESEEGKGTTFFFTIPMNTE